MSSTVSTMSTVSICRRFPAFNSTSSPSFCPPSEAQIRSKVMCRSLRGPQRTFPAKAGRMTLSKAFSGCRWSNRCLSTIQTRQTASLPSHILLHREAILSPPPSQRFATMAQNWNRSLPFRLLAGIDITSKFTEYICVSSNVQVLLCSSLEL
jgi:hypothetical protein